MEGKPNGFVSYRRYVNNGQQAGHYLRLVHWQAAETG